MFWKKIASWQHALLLTIITGQSHISKVIVLSQVPKNTFDVVLEVIPLETQLFGHLDIMQRWFNSVFWLIFRKWKSGQDVWHRACSLSPCTALTPHNKKDKGNNAVLQKEYMLQLIWKISNCSNKFLRDIKKALPEAQQTHGIVSITWVISPTSKHANS